MKKMTTWMVAAALAAQGCGAENAVDVQEAVASDGARLYEYVPPNPREANSITGDVDLAVIFAEFDGFGPGEIDPQDLRTVLGNPAQGGIQFVDPPPFIQVAPYFEDVSYGQLRIHPTVFDSSVQLHTSPADYCNDYEEGDLVHMTNCNVGDLQRDILDTSVDQLGLNLNAYEGFLIVLNGMATPGIAKHSLNHGRAVRRVAMIRDVDMDLGYDAQPAAVSLKSLVIHELAHSLGNLMHAGHWYCPPDVVGPDPYDPAEGCFDVGNVDPWSPIGVDAVRGLSAYSRSLWGILERDQTYWAFAHKGHFQEVELDALEVTSSGKQEIRIPFDDNDTFYSVEYRRPIGVDAAPLTHAEAQRFVNLEEGDLIDGLVVRLRSAAADPLDEGETSIVYQLVTPDEPFYDPYNFVSLSVTPLKGNRAIVDVGVNVLFFDPAFTTER